MVWVAQSKLLVGVPPRLVVEGRRTFELSLARGTIRPAWRVESSSLAEAVVAAHIKAIPRVVVQGRRATGDRAAIQVLNRQQSSSMETRCTSDEVRLIRDAKGIVAVAEDRQVAVSVSMQRRRQMMDRSEQVAMGKERFSTTRRPTTGFRRVM